MNEPRKTDGLLLKNPSPIKPDAVLVSFMQEAKNQNEDKEDVQNDFEEEFENAMGYVFPWGYILEHRDVVEQSSCVNWEFYVTDLLRQLPSVGFWSDWFLADFDNAREILPPVGDITDATSWGVFGFIAFDEHADTRKWLETQFLQKHWPGMLERAKRAARLYETRDTDFYRVTNLQFGYDGTRSKNETCLQLSDLYGIKLGF